LTPEQRSKIVDKMVKRRKRYEKGGRDEYWGGWGYHRGFWH